MATAKSNSEYYLLKAASLYYIEGLSQSEIAERIGVSRPTVVRMLRQAREQGLVEIKITKSLPQSTAIATEIESTFKHCGLQEVIIIDEADLSPKEVVARAAGKYLQRTLRDHHVLGIGWSTTLLHVPSHFSPTRYRPSRIVQLAGSAGGEYGSNSYEIASRLSHKLEVPLEHIPAPVILATKEARDILQKDPTIRKTLSHAKECNFGVVGIGVVTKDSTLINSGYLKKKDIEQLAKQGAVGDILAHYYDKDGNEVDAPWDNRRISVDLKQIQKIDNLVAVAAGTEKAQAVKGALKGGYINTLITNMKLAEALLEIMND
jgi:DNA-binding transcriptional regulator LsrR (DeoR family)